MFARHAVRSGLNPTAGSVVGWSACSLSDAAEVTELVPPGGRLPAVVAGALPRNLRMAKRVRVSRQLEQTGSQAIGLPTFCAYPAVGHERERERHARVRTGWIANEVHATTSDTHQTSPAVHIALVQRLTVSRKLLHVVAQAFLSALAVLHAFRLYQTPGQVVSNGVALCTL